MTDLHTHILPGIDDGAVNVDVAIELLNMEYKQGIDRVALTSHFNCETTSVEEYIRKRTLAFEQLKKSLDQRTSKMVLKLGCEVFFSPWLTKVDIHKLCLADTNVLMLELPVAYKPPFLQEVLYQIESEGIIPLIAHVERYPYVVKDPNHLMEMIQSGACTQMNASALTGNIIHRRNAISLIREGLIHVIASDVHSIHRRPPMLKKALHIIERKLGKDTAMFLRNNADRLFEGEYDG